MVKAFLKPAPEASVDTDFYAFTDDVTELAYWIWTIREQELQMAVAYDDGAGSVAVPVPDLTIQMGVNLSPRVAYASQKEILDYRITEYFQSAAGPYDGTKTWSYSIALGDTMLYPDVRNAGALITSGGNYRYSIYLVLSVTTDANTGFLTTDPFYDTGMAASLATMTFNGVSVLLYEKTSGGAGSFTGTVDISSTLNW